MKKIITATILATLVLGTSVTAFAHGHSSSNVHSIQSICNIKNCTKTTSHTHNNTTYYAHYNGDSHTYHHQ